MASCSSGDELTDDGSYGASCLVVKSRPTQLMSDDDRSGSSSDSDSEDSERDGGERRSSSSSSSDSEDGELAGASMTAASAARQRAQAGSPAAQYELGKRYSDGDGVCSDDAEAVRWFRRAAKQGHVVAQHRLALCLAEGCGTPRDASEAVHWLRRAANKGHAPSAAELVTRERQLSSFLKSNVVVVSGRTARPAAELEQAALESLTGCTLEIELRRDGSWESLSGVAVTAPPAAMADLAESRGKLLLSLPRSSGGLSTLWSTIITDRRIRRYHVTAGPQTPSSSAAGGRTLNREGSPLSASERSAVEWRRASSRIPDLRGEAWCETWDSLGRSLGRDPANLAAACAQHAALNPELCEGTPSSSALV